MNRRFFLAGAATLAATAARGQGHDRHDPGHWYDYDQVDCSNSLNTL